MRIWQKEYLFPEHYCEEHMTCGSMFLERKF